MKKIAITQRLIENDSYHEVRDALDLRWSTFLHTAKIIPVILPTAFDFKVYFREFAIDGIILSGGNDLSIFSGSTTDLRRDNFEKQLVHFCISNEIPLLGVCRGMQFLASIFNGQMKKDQTHIATTHAIIPNAESDYYKYLKHTQRVNSYHQYCLHKIPREFRVAAWSDDGTIEAIEHTRHRIWAQMWHPEREEPFVSGDLELIKAFFK